MVKSTDVELVLEIDGIEVLLTSCGSTMAFTV